MQIQGNCHCGAVTFTAEVDPGRVVVCHCADCQSLSGAPFRAIVTAPIDKFSFEGVTKAYIKVAQSGNRRAQVFCPECGTPLWAQAVEHPTTVTIRLGSVKQRAQLSPSAQVWQQSAMPWLAQLASVPGFAQQPQPSHGPSTTSAT